MSDSTLQREATACPGCGHDKPEALYDAHDFMYAVDSRPYPIVRCTGCKLVYLAERPTVATIAQAYPATYLWRLAETTPYAPTLDATVSALWFRQLYARRAWFTAKRLPADRPARVLELGCGTGQFLAALAQACPGGTYVGIDFEVGPSPAGTRLVAGNVERADLADEEPFDMVCLWHALEHLHDPRRALQAAYARLAPGGWLLVGTQNFDAVSRLLKGAKWPFNDVPRHLVHFTPATLSALVLATGFADVRLHHLTEMFPSMGGFLFPGLGLKADGRLAALPGVALSVAFLPLELVSVGLGRGCVFNLVARKPG